MSDEISRMSSAELKNEIKNFQVDESQEQDSGGYESNEVGEDVEGEFGDQGEEISKPDIDGSKYIEGKNRYEYPDEQVRREFAEKEAQDHQEAEVEKQEQVLNYLERKVKESGGENQFAQNFQQAQNADYLDLKDKYFSVGNLVDAFAQEYSRGKIKISPEAMQNFDNPHEEAFLKWVGKSNVQRKYNVTVNDIADIIRTGAEQPPLRSKSKEFAFPEMTHPIPKEKPKKRQEREYQMPEISGDDFREMYADFAKKHPERYGRR